MGKLVITTNMSLDGVVEDPDGKEGFARGGWFNSSGGADLEQWAKLETAEALAADALLIGRHSDAWFAQRWNERGGEWADKLNTMPKYVVSTRPDAPRWRNATVVSGDDIARIKTETKGEILVYASYGLVRTLLDRDLVDELRLVVFPVVVGDGNRLFGPTAAPKPLRLLSTQSLGAGLVFLTYETASHSR
jgi:dihydrofolate reductase